jgi:hypothetical protein
MIGEMRDKETADIAIEASLTGHLVFSTLHTNSAVETVIRLLDLGCDSFNFADAMLGVLATRLCKRVCANCKQTYQPSREEYDELAAGLGPASSTFVLPNTMRFNCAVAAAVNNATGPASKVASLSMNSWSGPMPSSSSFNHEPEPPTCSAQPLTAACRLWFGTAYGRSFKD